MEKVKIIRAGTVIFVDEDKLDFYLAHGYVVLQSEKTPEHLKSPFWEEPKPAPSPVETPPPAKPAVIKVHIVEEPELVWDQAIKPEVEEKPIQPFEVPAEPALIKGKIVKSKTAGAGEAIQANESADLPPVKRKTRRKKAS